MLSSLCCRQSRNKQSYAEKLAKMDWYQLCLLCPASEDMVPPREPPGSQEERGKNGEGKTQRSPQGLRATPLQSPPCAVQLCCALEFALFLITFWPPCCAAGLCFHIPEPSPSAHFILNRNTHIAPSARGESRLPSGDVLDSFLYFVQWNLCFFFFSPASPVSVADAAIPAWLICLCQHMFPQQWQD